MGAIVLRQFRGEVLVEYPICGPHQLRMDCWSVIRRLSRRSGVTDAEFDRLFVRPRSNIFPRWAVATTTIFGLVDLFHVTTMFRGIKRRVEAGARRSARGGAVLEGP